MTAMEKPMTTFPPKNRRVVKLSPLVLEVEDRLAVHRSDPNNLIIWALSGGLDSLSPFDFRPDIHSKPVDDTGTVIYRSHNFEVRLTRAQLDRLICCDLKPLEYFQLRDLFGEFFEIHDDFYDPEDGTALQPKRPAND